MCILVISPTPSKNLRKDSGVVLKERFPTQTEFCLLGSSAEVSVVEFLDLDVDVDFVEGSFTGTTSSLSLPDFFFWRRFSACERTGVSSACSSSDSEDEESESSEDDDELELVFAAEDSFGWVWSIFCRRCCGFREGGEERDEDVSESLLELSLGAI